MRDYRSPKREPQTKMRKREALSSPSLVPVTSPQPKSLSAHQTVELWKRIARNAPPAADSRKPDGVLETLACSLNRPTALFPVVLEPIWNILRARVAAHSPSRTLSATAAALCSRRKQMRLLLPIPVLAVMLAGCATNHGNWYEQSFFLLHEDHHTFEKSGVGRQADPRETARLVALSRPDVVQMHAKGNPGWTTYPTRVGHTPPLLTRDVLAVWRDMARRDGYHFSIYYNIGRDREIMVRHPAWNRVKADGTLYNNMLCYHSGVAEGYLWPMIREIMAGYHPDGFWFDGSCFTVNVCYCDKCRERFRREQKLDAPVTPQDPGWAACHGMQRQIYREFIHQTAAMIHQLDPKCLVAVNWAYSLRMPEKPDAGIAYLTGDIGDNVSQLSAAAHWYDSQDLPFDLMTQVSPLPGDADPAGDKRAIPKPRLQMEQEMAVIIANGGRYFAWDDPTPESGLVPERHEFIGQVVAPFLRSRQPWCQATTRVPDVSLLHSAAAHYAATGRGSASFSGSDSRIDGATATLSRLHLNYEMIPDWRLARQDIKGSVLVVEPPAALSGKTIEALVTYVRSGGTLLTTGLGVTTDKRLQEMCGLTECISPQSSERLVARTAGGDLELEQRLFRLTLSTARPRLKVRDSKGQECPLVTRNVYGKGQVFCVAIPFLSERGKNALPTAVAESIAAEVLPSTWRKLGTTAPDSVEVILRQKGNDYVLHLVNLAAAQREINMNAQRRQLTITNIPPAPPCHVSVRLPAKPAAVWLQPEGVRLTQWRYDDGHLELDLPQFAIHQMIVIQNSKPLKRPTAVARNSHLD